MGTLIIKRSKSARDQMRKMRGLKNIQRRADRKATGKSNRWMRGLLKKL